MIARTSPSIEQRQLLAWVVSGLGVALLAWLSLTTTWVAPLAVVALAGGFIAFLRWPWLGCALLIASVPFQQFGAVGPATITRAAIPVALAGYLIWLTTQRQTLVFSRFAIPFGMWLFWMLATVLIANDRALAAAELARWAIAFGAFIIAVQFFVGATRERVVAVIAVMAIAGALEATIGTILSLLAFGPASFQIGDAFSRAFGTFGRPNTFAGYLEMTIFPVAWLAVVQAHRCWPALSEYMSIRRRGMSASRQQRQQLISELALLALLAGSSVIMLAGITASYSRGAWLGVAVGATFSALLFLRRAWLLVVAASPILVVVLMLVLSSVAPAALTDRLTSISDELRPFDASSIPITDENFAVVERMAHWQAGWRMFEDEPLTGVGIGNFNDSYSDYFVRGDFRFSQGHAHNYYIHVMAETGIVGLVLYLSLMMGFLFLAIRVAWGAPTGLARMLALGAVGSLTAVMVHNLFENLHVLNLGIQISAVWALAIAAHHRWRSETPDLSEGNMEYSRR